MQFHPNCVLAVAANTVIVEEPSLLEGSLSVPPLVMFQQPYASCVQVTGCLTGLAYHHFSPKGQAHQQGMGQ